MNEHMIRCVEDARSAASTLEKTGQSNLAHAVERLAQELFQSAERERIWRTALAAACREIAGYEEDR